MLMDINNTTDTNCNLPMQEFRINANPIAFEILTTKLYVNPILAIVRELLTNAYDAQKANGNPDTPILVNIPTICNSNFSIRDYGTGLNKEDILNLYTTFFESTKNKDNDFTGCFGLGSKTPFAYSKNFSVISYFNGIAYYYAVTMINSIPNIICTQELPTVEPNGLCITIPVHSDDFYNFKSNVDNFMLFNKDIRITGYKPLYRDVLVYNNEEFSLYALHGTTTYLYSNVLIRQGQNVYPLPADIANSEYNPHVMFKRGTTIVINVPIGTFSVAPSREHLSESAEDISKIKEYVKNFSQKLRNKLYDENDKDVTAIVDYVIDKYNAIILNRFIKKNILNTNMYKYVCQQFTDNNSFIDQYASNNNIVINTQRISELVDIYSISSKTRDTSLITSADDIAIASSGINNELIIIIASEVIDSIEDITKNIKTIRKSLKLSQNRLAYLVVQKEDCTTLDLLNSVRYISTIHRLYRIFYTNSIHSIDKPYITIESINSTLRRYESNIHIGKQNKIIDYNNKSIYISHASIYTENSYRYYMCNILKIFRTNKKITIVCTEEEGVYITRLLRAVSSLENTDLLTNIYKYLIKHNTNEDIDTPVKNVDFKTLHILVIKPSARYLVQKSNGIRIVRYEALKKYIRTLVPNRHYRDIHVSIRDACKIMHTLHDEGINDFLNFNNKQMEIFKNSVLYKMYDTVTSLYDKSLSDSLVCLIYGLDNINYKITENMRNNISRICNKYIALHTILTNNACNDISHNYTPETSKNNTHTYTRTTKIGKIKFISYLNKLLKTL